MIVLVMVSIGQQVDGEKVVIVMQASYDCFRWRRLLAIIVEERWDDERGRTLTNKLRHTPEASTTAELSSPAFARHRPNIRKSAETCNKELRSSKQNVRN